MANVVAMHVLRCLEQLAHDAADEVLAENWLLRLFIIGIATRQCV